MSEGGHHPRATPIDPAIPLIEVTGIGIRNAQQIWYRALTFYMTSATNFADARSCTVHAASDLFGFCSKPAVTVQKAWDAVGVPYPHYGISFPPNPEYSPCILNLIKNPSFEVGFNLVYYAPIGDGWNWQGAHIYLYGDVPDPNNSQAYLDHPHTGRWRALLNGSFSPYPTSDPLYNTSYLYQDVEIPATVSKATLSFWINIVTEETVNIPHDTLKIQLRDPATNIVLPGGALATYSDINKTNGYVSKAFDVTGFKGKKVRVYFDQKETNPNRTHFLLDDILLNVQ